jgi:hypothetical protein
MFTTAHHWSLSYPHFTITQKSISNSPFIWSQILHSLKVLKKNKYRYCLYAYACYMPRKSHSPLYGYEEYYLMECDAV